MDVAEPLIRNGVEPDPPRDIPAVRLTARQLLDRAKDRAEADSPDGRYIVHVPVWGADVTLRALTFAELSRIQIAAGAGTEGADPIQAVRLSLHASIVDPPFSPKEIDEILDDPAQVEAGLLLTAASERINRLGQRGQAVAAASFRGAAESL